MINDGYILIFLGMGLVTYLPRWLPLFVLAKRNLPEWFVEWLDLIPASILSVLLLPELVTAGVPRNLVLFQPKLLVAVPTFLFALKTKSLGGTVIVGMVLFWIVSNFI